MVAGYLLDANNLEGSRGAALSEEQRASLAHNLRCVAAGGSKGRPSARMHCWDAVGAGVALALLTKHMTAHCPELRL